MHLHPPPPPHAGVLGLGVDCACDPPIQAFAEDPGGGGFGALTHPQQKKFSWGTK